MRKITTEIIRSFHDYLINEEKAAATVNKYLHDVGEFQTWLGEQELCKTAVLGYRSYLCERYAPTSVNAALSSLNSFFNFMEWYDLRVKNLKFKNRYSLQRIRNCQRQSTTAFGKQQSKRKTNVCTS